jgi:hypothetical protein
LLVPLLGPLFVPLLVPLKRDTVGELNTFDRVEDASTGVVLGCDKDIREVDEDRDVDVLVVSVVDATVPPLGPVGIHVLQVSIAG